MTVLTEDNIIVMHQCCVQQSERPRTFADLNNISDVIFYGSVGERSRALALLNAALYSRILTVLTEDNIIVTHLYSRLLTVLTEDNIIVTHLYSRLLTVVTEDNMNTSVLQAFDSPN